jgi:hypothetical protein
MHLKILPISRANPEGVLPKKSTVKPNRRSRQLHPILLREEILRSGNAEVGGAAAGVVADVAMDEMMDVTGHPSHAQLRPR